jgi:MFS family permease
MLSKILPTPKDYPKELVASLRRNLRMHLFDGSVYVLGMSLVSVQTIIPVFIRELGGGPLAISSVQVLWTLGANIPSAFVAFYLQRRLFFKPAMVGWGFVHRAMLFVCGIATFFIVGKVSSDIAVPFFIFLIFLVAAFGSLSGLPWFQVYTKTVPVQLRGRLMGIRQLLGSGTGIIGGSIVSVILATVFYPLNFSILFISASLITMVSFYFLLQISEQPSVINQEEAKKIKFIAEAKRIIKNNINFRYFLFADAFGIMSIAVASFYSVYAIEKFGLPASYAGTFTAIVMITNVVANIAFGIIGDTYGHKVNLLIFTFCSGSAALLAVLSPNILLYGFVFIFLACSLQVQLISRLPLVAEMCSENERPVYVGITNTLTAPAMLIGLLFGWFVPKIGYSAVFGITALLAAGSFFILHKFVEEPRYNRM